LATVCRKTARNIVTGGAEGVKLSASNVESFLGIPRFRYGLAEKEDEIGVATGLAWTDTGGDVLTVEATVMKGKGGLILTGKLGEVIRESAQAGKESANEAAIALADRILDRGGRAILAELM
jgi:ATP-dependent Lon protease